MTKRLLRELGTVGLFKLIDIMDNYSWVEHVRIRGIHQLPHP